MPQENNTIFISFSSNDIGEKGYVQAVESAITCLGGYKADHMNCGVIDATVTQSELDKRIRRSRLVIMVLDQQYKDCKRLRHEFEEVTQRGNKIRTLIFIKDYDTSNEIHNQRENIFNALNINENRYIRFEDAKDLRNKVEIQLNRWYREEERPMIERKRRKIQICLCALAVLALGCFWWAMHYIKSPVTSDIIVDTPPEISDNGGGKSNGGNKELIDTITIVKPLPPKPDSVKVQTNGGRTTREVTEVETSNEIMANTFVVDCDDESFRADIYDAVSQVLPSLSQPVDASKAQWTISVKRDSVKDIQKILESDPLQVEVNYTVVITDNKNKVIIERPIKNVRGHNIVQDKNDAINNANEEASKKIANIIADTIKKIQQ